MLMVACQDVKLDEYSIDHRLTLCCSPAYTFAGYFIS